MSRSDLLERHLSARLDPATERFLGLRTKKDPYTRCLLHLIRDQGEPLRVQIGSRQR